MRRILIAGNWKLNKGPRQAADLAHDLVAGLIAAPAAAEVLVCPPFVSLPAVYRELSGSPVRLGAQNCAAAAAGAYTGEVSAEMLAETGAEYVIVAHSERRSIFGETDDDFIRKIDLVHAAGMSAIFCYGEQLAERKSGAEQAVVRRQIDSVLPRLAGPTAANLVLAYEPVWAIGTGETATPEQAQEIHALSRGIVGEILGHEAADAMRILYGGSMKPGNARDLLGRADIDGGLVGGASLDAADFMGIISGAAAV